ncbi:hypothetical protein BLNAU_10957 [Blattamonas nauphoetae]|uniref:Uncharacterized protein n=1 Tax=Blattamonas nauphoetae TaxID=2049346 RepID=A0ABQ9XR95_9EUKA|nr:hypothetical protein BLNAU_10957 [Blattamonas nauphoetae]
MDCSPFLNWMGDRRDSIHSKAIVFMSLVATVKSQPACIMVLISSGSQALTTAAMEMLSNLLLYCSPKTLLSLVKADLISEFVSTLNPQSLSFPEADDIHINAMDIIRLSVSRPTPNGLQQFGIEDDDEQQAVHETVLRQVLAPSEKYICHLCTNRYSIVDGLQSTLFLVLLAKLLRIYPSYQPTMNFVLHIPVVLTIPSCLTFFNTDGSIWYFLSSMIDTQREWNEKGGEERQTWKTVLQMLSMEGIEDVVEEKLQNDKQTDPGRSILDSSIEWNNLLGMHFPWRG